MVNAVHYELHTLFRYVQHIKFSGSSCLGAPNGHIHKSGMLAVSDIVKLFLRSNNFSV